MSLLADITVRSAKPKEKPYTLSDGGSLYLRIDPTGKKTWVYRCYIRTKASEKKKQTKYRIGEYPLISVKRARELRDQAKLMLVDGIVPGTIIVDGMGEERESNFREYAEKWKKVKFKKLGATQPYERGSTASQIEKYFVKDVYPVIGNISMEKIESVHIFYILRNIEKRGSFEIRNKVRRWLNELFRYAKAKGLIKENPLTEEMDELLGPSLPAANNPYLTMNELPQFFVDLRKSRALVQNLIGVKLLLLTGVRPGELRLAQSSQFDLENAIWTIPPENVKQLKRLANLGAAEENPQIKRKLEKFKANNVIPPYLIPLPRQAVALVRQLELMQYPGQRYLLGHRSGPDKKISENTLNKVISSVGYKDRLTSHGIRATLSTALNELKYRKDIIEAQLSHSDKDQIRATYNHAEYVEERRQMMQEWANRLESMGMFN